MRIIKYLIISVLAIAIVVVSYIFSLTPNKRWLLFTKSEAEIYGNALLSKDLIIKENLKLRFIDCLIVTDLKAKTVLFSPHDNHDVALIYAPTHEGKELIYESDKAVKITGKWFAVKLTGK